MSDVVLTSRQRRRQQQVLWALKNRFNNAIRTYISYQQKIKIPYGARCVLWSHNVRVDLHECRIHGSYTLLCCPVHLSGLFVSDVTLNAAHCHLSCMVYTYIRNTHQQRLAWYYSSSTAAVPLLWNAIILAGLQHLVNYLVPNNPPRRPIPLPPLRPAWIFPSTSYY